MSCLTNGPITIDSALDTHTYNLLTASLMDAAYTAVPLGGGVKMCVTDSPQEVTDSVAGIVSTATGINLVPIAVFVRYNDEHTDTSFRIHSDGEVLGEQPTVACVLYLNDGNTGTALFEDRDLSSINTEDDGGWQISHYAEQKTNSMFIYNAKQFHSRWPHQADGPRFTLVGFFKDI